MVIVSSNKMGRLLAGGRPVSFQHCGAASALGQLDAFCAQVLEDDLAHQLSARGDFRARLQAPRLIEQGCLFLGDLRLDRNQLLSGLRSSLGHVFLLDWAQGRLYGMKKFHATQNAKLQMFATCAIAFLVALQRLIGRNGDDK